MARDANPRIQGMRLRADAAAERIPQAGAWSNPVLALGLRNRPVDDFGTDQPMTMNVIERTQEIGMLRSIGLTRGQVLTMILAEAGLMGLIGGFLGLVLGILLTRIFLLAMTAMSGYKVAFVLPLVAIFAGVIISIVVSQLAAIFPARRAANIRILEAIQYE